MTLASAKFTAPPLAVLLRGLTLMARRYSVTEPATLLRIAERIVEEIAAGELATPADMARRSRALLESCGDDASSGAPEAPRFAPQRFNGAERDALRRYYVESLPPESVGLSAAQWDTLKSRARACMTTASRSPLDGSPDRTLSV